MAKRGWITGHDVASSAHDERRGAWRVGRALSGCHSHSVARRAGNPGGCTTTTNKYPHARSDLDGQRLVTWHASARHSAIALPPASPKSQIRESQ